MTTEGRCANCGHFVGHHGLGGCTVHGAPGNSCDCLFDYDGGTFNSRMLPVTRHCPGYYKITSGSIVWCARENGHPGEHEGYYPGDIHRSHWKDRPVTDERCNSHNSDTPGQTAARDEQVGGNHYSKHKIQPWDIWKEYGLDPWLAGVVKYILRAGHKGVKLEDLKKARHYLDRAIEIEEGK